MSAPIIAGPNLGTEFSQAAAAFPQQEQEYKLRQAELDAQTMSASSQKLALLTKIVGTNQAMASNPQMISAAQAAFKGLGIPAPMKNVNGVQSLDTDALYAFGPASSFISDNLGLLLSFQPSQRGDLIKAFTNQDLPPEMAQRLSALPQRMISTPAELSGLYSRAASVVNNLSKPGSTIEGAISVIKPINEVLQQNGMPGVSIEDLEGAGLYQNLINKAYAQGLQGAAAQKQAAADYDKIKTELAPAELAVKQEDADARMVSAQASSSRAASEAARNPAVIAKDLADAGKAEADTKKTIQEVATGGASLKDLETNANNAQALSQRLQTYLNDPTSGLNAQITAYKAAHPEATVQNDPQLKSLNDTAYEYEQRIKGADKAAAAAQAAFQSGQSRLHSGAPSGTPHQGHAPAGAPTKTAPDGTVIYKGPDGKAYRDDNGQPYTPHQ